MYIYIYVCVTINNVTMYNLMSVEEPMKRVALE